MTIFFINISRVIELNPTLTDFVEWRWGKAMERNWSSNVKVIDWDNLVVILSAGRYVCT